MTNINDKTMIPLSWAVGAMCGILAPIIAAAMWVKGNNDWSRSVDGRLYRIEKHLHIEPDLAQKSIKEYTPEWNLFDHASAAGLGGP